MFHYDDFIASTPVMLAPMAGVSDEAMRQLCIEQGAQLTFTEMVSAKGLSYANRKTADLIGLAPNEQVIGVQLFGHEPDTMAAQAHAIAEKWGNRLAVIDINMGCPARKIITKGDGGSLMQRPDEAESIARAVVRASAVPVTVKFRRGFAIDDETAVDFARRLEQTGIAALTVHGRYVAQMYHGCADWDVIARVKQAVRIPVIGNGDVVDGPSALALVRQTECDGVMIARAAEGNPWVFSQAVAALAGQPIPEPPTYLQRIVMARRHALLLSQRENGALVRMRKHAAWYFKGMPGASAARGAVNACCTIEDFQRVFDSLEAAVIAHQDA